MVLQPNVTNKDLLTVAEIIAQKVSRPVLQEALVESRLIGRTADRDEARRLARNPGAWTVLIKEGLENPEKRAAALRALGLLVNSYLKLPGIDNRVENSIRKAHQAAERGDTQRLQREVGRLAEFGTELAIVELRNPIAVLYIWAGSEHARVRIADLSVEKAADEAPETGADLAALDTTTQPRNQVDSSVAQPKLGETALLSELQLLAQAPTPPSALDWNLTELLSQEPLPPSCVPWPTTQIVTADLKSLQLAAHSLVATETPADTIPIDQIRLKLDALEGALTILAQAPKLLDDLKRLEQDVRETAAAHVEAFDAPSRSEAEHALTLLAGDLASWASAIAILDKITTRHHQECEERRTEILDICRPIATLAAELPQERQTIAETKVRFLARRQRLEELRKIHDEIVEELVAVRARRARIQEAAAKAAGIVSPIADRLPDDFNDVLLSAVKSGETASVNRALEQAKRLAKAESAKGAVAPGPPTTNEGQGPASPITPIARAVPDPPSITAQQPKHTPLPMRVVSFAIGEFTPRDRITQRSQLPSDTGQLLNLMLQRAFQEMRRDSILGVIDHALDIILLANRNLDEGRPWADVGLALLAALPAATPAFQEWGEELADELSADFQTDDAGLFSKYAAFLVARPGFADAVAERFTQKEVEPILSTVAQVLYNAVCRQSPYLLQDLAGGIAEGARYGDTTVAKELLIALGNVHGLEAETIQRFRGVFDSSVHDPRAFSVLKSLIPAWLLDATQTCRGALSERRTAFGQRAPVRGSFNVQVPQSVQSSGGFVFSPGAEVVDVAFQVGNPQSLRCIAAELVVPAQRNAWLARDAISYLGPLPAKTRLLAPLRLHLTKELVESQRLEIQVEIRYKERDSGPTRFQDDKFSAAFHKLGVVAIEDYDGASGKPIILQGDALRLSSEGVRNALTEALHNLKRGSLAALILGRRRRGKTSILTTIARDPDIRKDYVILQDSVEDLPFRSLGDVLGHLGEILDRAARYLDIQLDAIEPVLRAQPHLGWTVLQEWLANMTERLREQKRILLLLDEFQKWISLLDPEGRTKVLAIFRGLMNRPLGEPLSIAIVLSGLTNIREYTKTSADFLNAFRIYEVKAFGTVEAAALIRSNASIEFDARALARISELSGGNPFLINLLGNDIASRLREHGRPYCFADDVERVVKSQLDDRQNSRVWNFLQYLLKQGEEDHASEILELPGLLALAWTLKTRGSRRAAVAVEEIVEELRNLDVECDAATLTAHLEAATQNELAVKQNDRYSFASGWLGEWLGVIVNEKPGPVKKAKDQDLILNRYRIVELLDRGGQGTVYLGQDTLTFDSPVILKVYARTQGDGLPSISEREAKALCAIQHTAVVRCYSYGTDAEMGDVLVLERVKGQTLRQLLTERSKGSVDLCGVEGKISTQVKLLEQLATALAECHSVGVVHKDLKPENILLEHSAGMWFPKIIDFGISSASLHGNQPGATVGPYTPGYVAPERYRGEPRRAAADIYSLGVVAYELLTGISPFPSDLVASMKAQQDGAFRPLRELRPTDVTVRLAELIESMISPNPLDRPNALTLASVLPAALQAADWKEFLHLGRKAYADGDAESAYEHLDKAARTAKEQEHQSADYLEVLRLLLDSARDCGKVFQIAPQLVQPTVRAVLHNQNGRKVLEELVTAVLQDAHVASREKDAQRATIVTLLDLLLAHEPGYGLAIGVDIMLKSITNPAVWENRETVYEVGINYRATNLLSLGMLESWCIAASRLLREKNATLDESQLWLRRGERLGIATNAEFRREATEVEKLLRNTANARELPPLPTSQEDSVKTVGEDERGHLNVQRIRHWVARMLKRHPYVQAVRRVRKDPNLTLRPTRVLEMSNIGQHLVSLPKTDANRIIPAVLDESYCMPPGTTVLRINIVLAEATTPRQRECAFERLRRDDALFGEDS